jgi:ATP-dependent Lon protease
MARDAVFNATAVVRKLSGLDPSDYDVHVNIVGGGRVDGPSAGAAVTIAILSALTERLVRQDVAITGEVSIQGCIKEVGGIPEKIYGARQAGMKRIIVPAENANEIPDHLKGIEVVTVSRIEEVCRAVLTGGDKVELAH